MEPPSLEALKELRIPQILVEADFNGRQRAEALGNIIGRMCAPCSEFEGNVSEGNTLQEVLQRLQAPAGALVIMDAGIASEQNLQWLHTNNCNYLVVSRERKRDIDMEQTSVIQSAGGRPDHTIGKSSSPAGRSSGR